MIKNGLYKITTEILDGVGISNVHIIILHDGKLHGGGPFFYTVGSYTCSGGKWKGEATTQEHTRFLGEHPLREGKVGRSEEALRASLSNYPSFADGS
jgi:hypothetical protein